MVPQRLLVPLDPIPIIFFSAVAILPSPTPSTMANTSLRSSHTLSIASMTLKSSVSLFFMNRLVTLVPAETSIDTSVPSLSRNRFHAVDRIAEVLLLEGRYFHIASCTMAGSSWSYASSVTELLMIPLTTVCDRSYELSSMNASSDPEMFRTNVAPECVRELEAVSSMENWMSLYTYGVTVPSKLYSSPLK